MGRFVCLKEYQLTAGAAKEIAPPTGEVDGNKYTIVLTCLNSNMVINVGTSTVTADGTVTSGALADGNYTIFPGMMEEVGFKTTPVWIDVVGTDTVYARIGYFL